MGDRHVRRRFRGLNQDLQNVAKSSEQLHRNLNPKLLPSPNNNDNPNVKQSLKPNPNPNPSSKI